MRLLTMKGARGRQKTFLSLQFKNCRHHLNPLQEMSFINASHPHMKGAAIIRVTDCVYKASCIYFTIWPFNPLNLSGGKILNADLGKPEIQTTCCKRITLDIDSC